MPAHQQLREATRPDHEAIDAAFGRFDLADREGYAAFLIAHARVVPAIEAALRGTCGPPPLRPRTPLLIADLTALSRPEPSPLAVDPPGSPAAAWGMAYVLEGSRLGGGLLARSVAGLPHLYLGDVHQPGEWRSFCRSLDEALVEPPSVADAIAAARRTFAMYGEAIAAP